MTLMGLARFRVSGELLRQMFAMEEGTVFVNGCPSLNVYGDWEFVVEAPSLPKVAPGQPIPECFPKYRTLATLAPIPEMISWGLDPKDPNG